jgi:hypothetical protein
LHYFSCLFHYHYSTIHSLNVSKDLHHLTSSICGTMILSLLIIIGVFALIRQCVVVSLIVPLTLRVVPNPTMCVLPHWPWVDFWIEDCQSKLAWHQASSQCHAYSLIASIRPSSKPWADLLSRLSSTPKDQKYLKPSDGPSLEPAPGLSVNASLTPRVNPMLSLIASVRPSSKPLADLLSGQISQHQRRRNI